MLDNLTVYEFATACITTFIFATFGFGMAYAFDRAYNQSTADVSEYIDISPSQDIPSSDDAVPTVASEHYFLDPQEQCCMVRPEASEPPFTRPENVEAITTTEYKRYSTDYRNELWPSPRPVNFVKALVKGDHVQIEGRITHGKAIEILSNRAQMTPEQFLSTDPITYTKIFMPHQYNVAMLIGQSIQRLEYTIRRHQYLDMLRRHG